MFFASAPPLWGHDFCRPHPAGGARPLWRAILSLGLLGIIRTFPSWSVVLEVEGF
jgi:hypothetical protein